MRTTPADLRAYQRAVDASRDAALAEHHERLERSALRAESIEERAAAAIYRMTADEFSEHAFTTLDPHQFDLIDAVLHAVLQQYRATPTIGPATPPAVVAMHRLVEELVRIEVIESEEA